LDIGEDKKVAIRRGPTLDNQIASWDWSVGNAGEWRQKG